MLLNYFVRGIDITQGGFNKKTVNPNDLTITAQVSFSAASKLPCITQCSASIWCRMACVENSICNLYAYSVTPTSSTPSVQCYFSEKPSIFSLVQNLNIHWIEETVKSTRMNIRTPLTTTGNCLDQCENRDSCSTACMTTAECVETDMMLDPRFDESSVPADGKNNFGSAETMNCYTKFDSKNLIIGQSSQSFLYDANKKGPNYLTMGLYSRDKNRNCLKLYDSQGPWFVIEFSSQVSFNTIRLTVQDAEEPQVKWLPNNVKIFVADSYNGNNDFSNDPHYQLIHTIPNSLVFDQIYETSVSVSNKQLIAFKQETESYLIVCYLEIY